MDEFNGFRCVCPSGYGGDTCEDDVDDCTYNPCQNNGVCIDKLNSFECRCLPGFIGSLCQENVDDCLTKPCANGGTCKDGVNDYTCECQAGFAGKDCSINVDECAMKPCKHGVCEDRVNDYMCHCDEGYSGRACDVFLSGIGVSVQPTKDSHKPTSEEVSSMPDRGPLNGAKHTETEDDLSSTHIAVIIALSVTVPILIIIIVVIIKVLRRRRRRNSDEEEAKRQNRQNQQNSMNNRSKDSVKDCNVLSSVPPAGSSMCLKLTNEDNDSYKKPTNTDKNSQHFITDSMIHEQIRSSDKTVTSRKLEETESLSTLGVHAMDIK